MSVQDNQQATINWLIGILDTKANFEKSPRIMMTWTNEDIVIAFETFLRSNNIESERFVDKKRSKHASTVYRLYIKNGNCLKLYNIVQSNLEIRKYEFQEILKIGASETLCDLTQNPNWLAGAFQGIGVFEICRYFTKGEKPKITPQIILNTENLRIIDRMSLTLKSLECAFYLKKFVPTVYNSYTRVTISGYKRCQRFFIAMKDFWVGKQDSLKTSLILQLAESRIPKEAEEPYTEKEMQLFYRVKQMS